MGKKQKTNETVSGRNGATITAGRGTANYTYDELMSLLGSGRTGWTKNGEFETVGSMDETALAGYSSYLDYLANLDARDYNSVQAQVERLMAAGMSRTQALLTATSGEASATQTGDLAGARSAQSARKQNGATAIINGIAQCANTALGFVNGYGNMYDIAGDALVQPIGEEIYSWINRGINVPDAARADAQHFKQWCLGTLRDPNGGFYEPPVEAKELIASRAWSRMAAHPCGWTAFQKYFNANYSTRGYHEDYQDAQRIRRMATAELVGKRMENLIDMPDACAAGMQTDFYRLQGITIDVGSLYNLNSNEQHTSILMYDHKDPSNNDEITPEHIGETSLHPIFLNDDGSLSEDCPAILEEVINSFYIDLFTSRFQSNEDFVYEGIELTRENQRYQQAVSEIDLIMQQYQKYLADFDHQIDVEGQNNLNAKLPAWLRTAYTFRNAWNRLNKDHSFISTGAQVVGNVATSTSASLKAIKTARTLGKLVK